MRRFVPLSLAAWLALTVAGPAIANDTAMHPGAYGPEPVGGGITGKESVIRMVKEHLDIRYGRWASTVTVTFTFRNTLKNVTAKQLLGFPDIAAAQAESGRRDPKGEATWYYPQSDVTGPMTNVRTRVNGQVVPTKLQYGFVSNAPNAAAWKPGSPQNGHLMAWHVAWVSFPPGKDVTVERRYTVQNGGTAVGVNFFEYITHTGNVWNGKIGELVADVTLADGLTVSDMIFAGRPVPKGVTYSPVPDSLVSLPAYKEWQVLSPTKLRLVWKDFEPAIGGNRAGFQLTSPAAR